MAGFDYVRLVDDYIHLWSKRDQTRVTLSLSQCVGRRSMADLGEPQLSSDGFGIRWPDAIPPVAEYRLSQLLQAPTKGAKLNAVEMLPLASIAGIHPRYEQILSDAGVVEPLSPASPAITKDALTNYLSVYPLIVHRYRGRIYCCGNIHGYRGAIVLLDRELIVPVRIYAGRAGPHLDQLLTNELLTVPVIQASTPCPPLAIYRLWRWLQRIPGIQIPYPPMNSVAAFARWLRIDERKIRIEKNRVSNSE